jgi:cell division protein FtsQ
MIWNRPDLMNRLANLLWGLGLLLILVTVVLMVIRLPLIPVREVMLSKPLVRVQIEDIRAGIAPSIGGNFFTVDLKAIRQGVERQPWVYRADVRRQGLGSLTLDIDEQVPVARWGAEGDRGFSVWLNRDGDTFEVADTTLSKESSALPVLHGPLDTGNDLMARYVRYSTQLQPTGRTIRQLELSPRLSWSLKLDNGTRVELGRERTMNGADQLVALFVQLYPQLVGNRAVPPTVVDLRYPAGVAVRYPAGVTSSASTPSDRKGKS